MYIQTGIQIEVKQLFKTKLKHPNPGCISAGLLRDPSAVLMEILVEIFNKSLTIGEDPLKK